MRGLKNKTKRKATAVRERRSSAVKRRQQWRSVDHDARLDMIIVAAIELLRDQGLGDVTMRRVAAKLGIGTMTLYTYVDGQDQLRREMIRRGFQMLSSHCRGSTASAEPHSWTPGATAYLEFARRNPNLYRLMFSTPSLTREDLEIARAGYECLLERVRGLLANAGIKGAALKRATTLRAGLYWTSLHGLASIIIDERLELIGEDEQTLLKELLPRIAPA